MGIFHERQSSLLKLNQLMTDDVRFFPFDIFFGVPKKYIQVFVGWHGEETNPAGGAASHELHRGFGSSQLSVD